MRAAVTNAAKTQLTTHTPAATSGARSGRLSSVLLASQNAITALTMNTGHPPNGRA